MELPDTTSGIPLVLARSVKIRPGGNLEVPLECTRQLTNQMDIRIDTAFHHKNPNIYIPPSCINNPNNQYNPEYMPLTIFNLSTVNHLYVVHQQDCLLSCQLRLLSLQPGRNMEPKGSNWSRPLEHDNQTPPPKLDMAPFWHVKPQPIRGFPTIEPRTF